ncbi:protein-tyrosine-phosphatase [Xylanibacillus composti]|uniref:Protein-tyrosine-phosphatase n=1 Tax=Xylanibacillus composti TaxID=1572762 RepID=A0A8J4M473_9BACL|nr:tyrosine-protein phosphatase [Xylanibacillus composti]MDT9726633.1 protein-tyrosine-phosphatase [Xylanibacillus composti]GIQ70805.1 protein-tyrosine-phosphatase [Xylanibacillus composti]
MAISTSGNGRLLELEGAYNVRDIGGYQTAGGRLVQKGRFLRADGLHRLTEQDQEKIVSYGVSTVIDLRHAHELEAKKNVFADSDRVRYCHISLVNPANSTLPTIRCLGDLYVQMLDDCGDLLREVFEQLAVAEGQVVLFHCAAGKDRTGVVAALLLGLAGVDREAIIADYAESAVNLTPIMDEFRAERPDMLPEEMYERFLGSAPANMEQMLDYLDAKYHGAEAYLLSIGLGADHIDRLKQKLLA